MWRIVEHRSVEKALRQAPLEVQLRYEKWKDIVSISGPHGLRAIKGFYDEKLRGERSGYRSSRLSRRYRVLYRERAQSLEVIVERVTPHDYRVN